LHGKFIIQAKLCDRIKYTFTFFLITNVQHRFKFERLQIKSKVTTYALHALLLLVTLLGFYFDQKQNKLRVLLKRLLKSTEQMIQYDLILYVHYR